MAQAPCHKVAAPNYAPLSERAVRAGRVRSGAWTSTRSPPHAQSEPPPPSAPPPCPHRAPRPLLVFRPAHKVSARAPKVESLYAILRILRARPAPDSFAPPEHAGQAAHARAGAAPPPSLPYKVDTSRPSLRTNWTRRSRARRRRTRWRNQFWNKRTPWAADRRVFTGARPPRRPPSWRIGAPWDVDADGEGGGVSV
jgi:hypothetical protein